MTDLQIQIMDRLDTATFDELAEFVQTSVVKAGDHAKQSLECLIEAGGALCEMRDRMPGQYMAWLGEVGIKPGLASRCQRLYTYRAHLPLEAYQGFTGQQGGTYKPSLGRALGFISHLPALTLGNPLGHQGGRVYTDEQRSAVRRMAKDGVPVMEIVRLSGMAHPTVQGITNPTGAKDRIQRAAVKSKAKIAADSALRKQIQRDQRDQLAKATGKEMSVAYSHVRQALAALAKMDAPADRASLTRVDTYLRGAESALVNAMRAERME